LDLRQNPESSIEPYNPKHFPQQQPLIGICLFLSTPPSLTWKSPILIVTFAKKNQ
jgi:hypothetical protein